MLTTFENYIEERLPKGITKRIRLTNTIGIPTTSPGTRVIDYDERGRVVDIYFEQGYQQLFVQKARTQEKHL